MLISQTHVPHRTSRPFSLGRLLFATLTVPLLALTGCATAPAPDTAPKADAPAGEENTSEGTAEQPSSDAEGTATFTVGDRVFAVELARCSVYEGGTEVMLAGPATEVGGDAVGYLDGEHGPFDGGLNGEFRIDIGASRALQSTDEFVALGSPSGTELTIVADGDGYVIQSGAWNENGEMLGDATLSFSCS